MTTTALLVTSQPVTHWPERIVLTLTVVAAIGVVMALMRRGWVRRGRGQADIAPLPPVPALPDGRDERSPTDLSVRYLGATRSGDWLDRIVVHGLGVPSAAHVTVATGGIWVLRAGAPDIFVASADVEDVRHAPGIAGRVYESDGVLVITWRLGDQLIDLGLRVRSPADAEALRSSIVGLVPGTRSLTSAFPTTTSGDSA